MTEAHISARLLTVLVDPVRLRRLRVAHRADVDLYAELLAVTAVIFAHRNSSANGTDLGVSVTPTAGSELTTTEAAAQLGITDRGVRKALFAGRLTGRRHGGRWLIDPASVAQYATRAA